MAEKHSSIQCVRPAHDLDSVWLHQRRSAHRLAACWSTFLRSQPPLVRSHFRTSDVKPQRGTKVTANLFVTFVPFCGKLGKTSRSHRMQFTRRIQVAFLLT